MAGRLWTKEEIAYLEDNWGRYSITKLAEKLNRTVSGVRQKYFRLGLQDARLHFDGITTLQLAKTIQVSYSTIDNWIANYSFPVRYKQFSKKQKVKVVYFKDLFKWFEANKQMIDFSRIEPNILGPEPDWLKEKRNADLVSEKRRRKKWTKEDELLLISMVNAYRYSYSEIARRLQRSENSIRVRLSELGLKARPVYRNNQEKYMDEEVRLMLEMCDKGYSFNAIAKRLKKSELGVRSKLNRLGYRFKAGVPISPKESAV
ncbi:SANT/Myb-like DNA-binding domain-containing protein [Bacillus pseudomycoides]|uniref:SANT/Myb-like DNA-binding domain-containing protein n=1 Tax=Bacillus bingmayongensis TaxID=1150157 RepID=A0ABU5JYR1_9BACI|nr:SANT/Myb-like DNA-binding domain-containing protein [Bacillus pseudomycoides]